MSNLEELRHLYPCMGDLFNHSKQLSPIKDIKEKDLLIPAFLQIKSLVKQHIDSFNQLITVDVQNIIRSKHNRRIESDVDPNFYLQYNNIRIDTPSYRVDHEVIRPTPHECRLRDLTYAGDIL